MLHELGFPAVFVHWIMQCLSTVSYSILVNGFPTDPIPAKKGLRQATPFFFALGMEYLSRCLQKASSDSAFKFHPRCQKMGITHMMFADDLLMFARADKHSVKAIFLLLSKCQRGKSHSNTWGFLCLQRSSLMANVNL